MRHVNLAILTFSITILSQSIFAQCDNSGAFESALSECSTKNGSLIIQLFERRCMNTNKIDTFIRVNYFDSLGGAFFLTSSCETILFSNDLSTFLQKDNEPIYRNSYTLKNVNQTFYFKASYSSFFHITRKELRKLIKWLNKLPEFA